MVEVREETESRCWGYVSKERIFPKKKKKAAGCEGCATQRSKVPTKITPASDF